MDIVSIITMLVTMLGSIPVVGKVLVVVIPAIAGIAAAVTALVAVWHGFVALLVALAKVPGLSGLASFAEKMKNNESKVDGFVQGTLLPLLNRLSAIPVPKVAEAPVVVAAKQQAVAEVRAEVAAEKLEKAVEAQKKA